MLEALWRRWWHGTSARSRRNGRSGESPLAYRPQIEALEGRDLPALLGGALVALAPVVDAVSMPQQPGRPVAGGSSSLSVTVSQNAPETVLDLGPAFAAIQGLQHKAGLQLSILGNTNARLVTPDLSGSALTLTYTRGLYGSATITVNATDADRVCAQLTVAVTVRPLRPVTGAVGVTPIAPVKLTNLLGTSR
jgi:hypothetical protein